MPFPPTFDNVWDITQPPDTQAANLLGQDIRNLKDDVMQRMSLLSGTFANRPTPEIVNAVWGGAGFGLVYFSTDTQQVFQWTGAAWTPISVGGNSTKFVDATRVVTAAGFTGIVNSVVIPANSLKTGSHIKLFWFGFTGVGAASTRSFAVNLGASVFTPLTGGAPQLNNINLVCDFIVDTTQVNRLAANLLGIIAPSANPTTITQQLSNSSTGPGFDVTVPNTFSVSVGFIAGASMPVDSLGLAVEIYL